MLESSESEKVRLISRETRGRVREGPSLSAGYTVNTYSKPSLYMTLLKARLVFPTRWFSCRKKTSALGKPDVSQQAALFHLPLADDVDIYI